MNKLMVFQITLFLVFAGGFGYMVAYTDVYTDIKSTIVDTVCFSCIGMDPVTHLSFTFETANGAPHPQFVLDNLLTKGPVFLAFRIDVCAACDQMDPILKSVFGVEFGIRELFYKTVDFDGSNVTFFHINKQQVSGEFLDSFYIYDKDSNNGVPMFVMITLGDNDGTVQPCYITAYSLLGESHEAHREEFLQNMISMGIDLYNQNILNYQN